MKRRAIPAWIAFVLLAMAASASAQDRFTVIHITRNFNPTPAFPHPCRATVVTETFPSVGGNTLTWVIRHGNAFNNDDLCKFMDKSLVSLHFQDQIFSSTSNLILTPKMITVTPPNGVSVQVWAFQEKVDNSAMKGSHKYQVFYGPPTNSVAIGPDPEVEVGCPDCGGGDK